MAQNHKIISIFVIPYDNIPCYKIISITLPQQQSMGNICNNGHLNKQEHTQTIDTLSKNYVVCQFILKSTTKVSLILGTYRFHRSQTLFLIAQRDYVEYSPELRQYAQNFNSVIQQISLERKRLLCVSTNKNSPYRKIQLCILPTYNSLESEQYIQQFSNVIKELISQNSDITFQLSFTTDNLSGCPNQILVAILIAYLSRVPCKLRLSIVSTQTKLLEMVRYQIMKGQNYRLKQQEDRGN